MQDFELENQLATQRYQQALAKQQQSGRMPTGNMVGNTYVRSSPFEHLAEVLRSYNAGQEKRGAEQELKDLQGKKQTAMADALRTYTDKATGAPAVASTTTPTQMPSFDEADAAGMQGVQGYGATTGAQAARAPDMRAAYGALMNAPDAAMRSAGMTGMAQIPQLEAAKLEKDEARQFRRDEAAATRQARMDELKMRMEDQRNSQAERLAAQKEMRQMMIAGQQQTQQMIAANRPQKPAGPDWKYDAGSDAWVKPPSAEFPMGQTTPNAGKASSLKNFDYLATNMLGEDGKSGTIGKTAQGGYFGLGGALGSGTQAAKEFDNTVEQMSTELRTVFRIPGEGALSDKEQAQYGIQLPKRGNDADLNRKIITDLRVRMNNRVNPQGVSPSQTPPALTNSPIYASDGKQRIVSTDGGKTWQPAK
jgi:hypothetical protein